MRSQSQSQSCQTKQSNNCAAHSVNVIVCTISRWVGDFEAANSLNPSSGWLCLSYQMSKQAKQVSHTLQAFKHYSPKNIIWWLWRTRFVHVKWSWAEHCLCFSSVNSVLRLLSKNHLKHISSECYLLWRVVTSQSKQIKARMTFNIIERFDIALISSNSCMVASTQAAQLMCAHERKTFSHHQARSKGRNVFIIVHRANVSVGQVFVKSFPIWIQWTMDIFTARTHAST